VHFQLVQIWEDLLDVRPIGIKDNFFALGGHSLLAARLFARIEQVCGKKLPLSTLFSGATIEHLADALTGETKTDSRAPLVAVQASGSRQPFFYLHGEWRGGAFYSIELARNLGPDHPFYLLEPYKFDGLATPPTLETMAAAHLKSLRDVQPEGPYLLGGYCNGGLMAYEMARQLRAEGQDVNLLVLMDPGFPGDLARLTHGFIRRIGGLVRLSPEKQFEWFLCLQHLYRYLRFSHYRHLKNYECGRSKSDSVPQGFSLKALVPRVETLRQDYPNIYNWAVTDYTFSLYPGKITFFWTSEESWRPVGWQKIVKAKEGEAEIRTIPGNHITSRTEHLPVLAEHLRDCVSKAQATAVGD
jgi:thioesterase domain-containing protein